MPVMYIVSNHITDENSVDEATAKRGCVGTYGQGDYFKTNKEKNNGNKRKNVIIEQNIQNDISAFLHFFYNIPQ